MLQDSFYYLSRCLNTLPVLQDSFCDRYCFLEYGCQRLCGRKRLASEPRPHRVDTLGDKEIREPYYYNGDSGLGHDKVLYVKAILCVLLRQQRIYCHGPSDRTQQDNITNNTYTHQLWRDALWTGASRLGSCRVGAAV